jgi:hypothetical protein
MALPEAAISESSKITKHVDSQAHTASALQRWQRETILDRDRDLRPWRGTETGCRDGQSCLTIEQLVRTVFLQRLPRCLGRVNPVLYCSYYRLWCYLLSFTVVHESGLTPTTA